MSVHQCDIAIVGAGAAGIAVAASLRKRQPRLSITLIDPAEKHYYQPGWTMVGRGVFTPQSTERATASLIPKGVKWLEQAVTAFDPMNNTLSLDNDDSVQYEQCVVAAGLTLNWGAVEGLAENLGNNGVTSNYRYDTAPYTWDLVKNLKAGRAIFNMSASFQLLQSGVDHQFSMPNYIPPEKLLSDLEQLELQQTDPQVFERFKKIKPEVIEFRPVEKLTLRDDVNAPAESNYWFRSKEPTLFGMALQHQLLAYISDYGLLRTATLPHKKELSQGPTFYTSIDHALWFHRPFSLDQWLLYAMDSLSGSKSEGSARGSVFDREGLLVSSTVQEGLIRQLS